MSVTRVIDQLRKQTSISVWFAAERNENCDDRKDWTGLIELINLVISTNRKVSVLAQHCPLCPCMPEFVLRKNLDTFKYPKKYRRAIKVYKIEMEKIK